MLFSHSVSQRAGVIQVVPLGTFPGKINIDVVSGHLWVAGSPDAQKTLDHIQPPHTVKSPCQVEWTRRSRTSTGNLIL